MDMAVTVSVSAYTLGGETLPSIVFAGPATVAELRERLQAAQPRQVFKILLADRELAETEALTGPEVGVTVVFDTDYKAMAVKSYDELDLKADLLRGIYSYGFERPSELQGFMIRPMLDGRSVIAQAQSGTGKTATYAISALQLIDTAVLATQVVVLVPTRELACPIQKVALAIGDFSRLQAHAVIGGASVRDDIDKLRENPHFVVGTPGRVHDLVSKRHLNVDALKLFVLDEIDELMSRGFKGLIFETLEMFPPHLQMAVFGTIMPEDVLTEMKRFMQNPVRLQIKKKELSLEGVRQFYVAIEEEALKADVLLELLQTLPITQWCIYCNTRRKLDFLSGKLKEADIEHSAMHAELDQREREELASRFVVGTTGVLLSTDLLARGDDVQPFPVVINYDLPQNIENYLHRIGRGSHHYRRGVAINFVTNNDVRTMKDIEKFYHTQIEEMPVDIADMI